MIFAAGLAACGVALILALVRAMRGPTPFDRLLAVNAVGTTVILGIALHGYALGRPEFVDISILYAVINFIGTFAVLKLFNTGGLGDTAGVGFISLGLLIYEVFTLVIVKLALVGIFLFFTSPIATHAVAQVALRSGIKPKLDDDSGKDGGS